MELIAVVTILGILMVTGIVSYTSMVERSHRRAAQDLLLAIYYGEQAYQSINRKFYGGLGPGSDATAWRTIYMENPNLGSIPITFTVSGSDTAFTATAAYSQGGSTMTVDESRVWCGSSTDPTTCPTWPIP